MLPVDVGLSVPKLGIPTDGEVPLNGIKENTNLINNNLFWLISCMLKLLSSSIQNNQIQAIIRKNTIFLYICT